jgi:uncharacterized phiE125 gp8 family phage protein
VIRWEYTQQPSVQPIREPLTLAEVRRHCAMSQGDDDILLDSFRLAARQAAETYLGRALYTQTRVLSLSEFAEVIWLPFAAPLQTVSTVRYYDTSGVQQTLSSSVYTVHTQQ